MISQEVGRILLFITGLLAAIQGTINFLGSLHVANDKGVNITTQSLYLEIGDYKNYCGFMSMGRAPKNIGVGNAECVGSDYEMDRGWFKSVEGYCLRKHKDDHHPVCYLNNSSHVMTFAILAGLCWIGAGLFSIMSAFKKSVRKTIALDLLLPGYANTVITFFSIMMDIGKIKKSCLNFACRQVRERALESSNEFLTYVLSSLVSIFIAGVLSLIAENSFGSSNEFRHELPPVGSPVIYHMDPDGVPYGVAVNNRAAIAFVDAIVLRGRVVIGNQKSHISHKVAKPAIGANESMKEISFDPEETSIAEFRKAIEQSTLEKTAGRKVNTGLIGKIYRRDSMIKHSEDGTQEKKSKIR